MKLHTVAANIFLVYQFATFVKTQGHDGANKVGCGDDGGAYVRFFNVVYECEVGQS